MQSPPQVAEQTKKVLSKFNFPLLPSFLPSFGVFGADEIEFRRRTGMTTREREENETNKEGGTKNRSIIVARAVGVACIPHSGVWLGGAAFRSILSLCIPSAEVTTSLNSI